MQHAHIDISRGLDGEPVVLACFGLREDEVAAAGRAVAATAAERYRTPRISADDVLELRELTAITDELEHGSPTADRQAQGGPRGQGVDHGQAQGGPRGQGVDHGQAQGGAPGLGVDRGQAQGGDLGHGIESGLLIRTLVFQPARLSILRDAIASFIESRDEAEWIREEDREPLALLRGLLIPLEQLCADAMRAALSPESHVG